MGLVFNIQQRSFDVLFGNCPCYLGLVALKVESNVYFSQTRLESIFGVLDLNLNTIVDCLSLLQLVLRFPQLILRIVKESEKLHLTQKCLDQLEGFIVVLTTRTHGCPN